MPPTEAALLFALVQKPLHKLVYPRHFQRVWPITVEALVGARPVTVRLKQELRGPSASLTNTLSCGHRTNSLSRDAI